MKAIYSKFYNFRCVCPTRNFPKPSDLKFNKLKKLFGIKVESEPVEENINEITTPKVITPIVSLTENQTLKPQNKENKNPQFAFRKKISTKWEIILNGQKFLVKDTFGVRAIHKLLKKNKENNESITVIPATTLYQDEERTIEDLKEVGKRLKDAVDLVFANIEPRTGEYELLRVFIKVSQSTIEPSLEYNPSNYCLKNFK